MASAALKPCFSRNLGARELILGTAIDVEVVYCQTGNESLPVSGSTYHWTSVDEIELISAEIQSTVAVRLLVA